MAIGEVEVLCQAVILNWWQRVLWRLRNWH